MPHYYSISLRRDVVHKLDKECNGNTYSDHVAGGKHYASTATMSAVGISLVSTQSLMANLLEQEYEGHGMYCHHLQVMGLNPVMDRNYIT